MNHLISNFPTAGCPGRLEDGGVGGRMGAHRREAVTFTAAYHVVVRYRSNASHENVSLDFGYTLC